MKSRTENIRRTVLVVEDEFVNSQLLGFILSEEYNVLYAENGQQALDILKENIGTISMVLTDIKMPVMDGFDLIKAIRSEENLGMIPIMVLTSESTYEEKSLDLGAIDFLTKPYDMPSIIKARVRRIIELSEGRMIIKATEKDYLSGLYIREFFFEYGQRLERLESGRSMDAVVIDLDRFHVMNELYGRVFGNRVLKTVGESLKSFLADGSGIGTRYENDIFYVLCDHHDSYDDLVEAIINKLKGLSSSIRFGVRIGVQPNVSRSMSFLQQFNKAKTACNSVKKDRQNPVAFYNEEMHKKELLNEKLLNDMQKALDEKQFVVWYQPKYNITGEKPVLCSSEALVRWKHPELGMVSPGVFIPLFETNALIQKLDHYVWNEAARQVAQWKKRFGVSIPVSVNISRIDFFDGNLEKTLLEILDRNGLSFDDFFLEVTESAYADNSTQLVDSIRKLRTSGFRIEMDDFGSGYSSLNSLSEMPVDIIKLDMSFVRRIHENNITLRVVELVIGMAKSLGAIVVAEGVENEMQYNLLKQIECDCVQGYYFSKPLPADEFEAFAEKRKQDLEVRAK